MVGGGGRVEEGDFALEVCVRLGGLSGLDELEEGVVLDEGLYFLARLELVGSLAGGTDKAPVAFLEHQA